jgi:hypothetical protein
MCRCLFRKDFFAAWHNGYRNCLGIEDRGFKSRLGVSCTAFLHCNAVVNSLMDVVLLIETGKRPKNVNNRIMKCQNIKTLIIVSWNVKMQTILIYLESIAQFQLNTAAASLKFLDVRTVKYFSKILFFRT